MKLRYYSHASFQLVNDDGVRLLCDPWVYNPISNTMWQFPECPIGPEEYLDQDYLYISHNHVDHYCVDTLEHFRRDRPIVMRRYPEATNPMKPTLERMGFERFVEIGHGETVDLDGAFTITLYADLDTNDSSIVVSDGRHEVFHQNDCMLSMADAELIGERHDLDVALLGLVNSSIYPTFFVMDPELKRSEADRIERKILDRTCGYGDAVGAKVVIPCASDMVFFSIPEADEHIGPTIDRLVRYAVERGSDFRVVTPSPGDDIDLDDVPEQMTPAYRDLDDLVAQLRALRQRPDVAEVLDRLAEWERGFVFDESVAYSLLDRFVAHLDSTFDEALAEQLPRLGRRFEVHLAIADGGQRHGWAIALDYPARAASLRRVSPGDTVPDGVEMLLELSGHHLQMIVEGALEFDDIRGGAIRIHRPGDFSTEEVVFWQVMMLFSTWMRTNSLFVGHATTFRYRVSPVFERTVGDDIDPRIVRDPEHGYRRVAEEHLDGLVDGLYEDEYYEAMQGDDRRFGHDEEAERELRWQRQTAHADLIAHLAAVAPGRRVVDLGAGLGELVESLSIAGFDALGIEPSATAVRFAGARGRNVHKGDLASFCSDAAERGAWDAVVLTNVLEHLPDARAAIAAVGELLVAGGVAVVRVPNDFTRFQEQARRAVDQAPWWVAVPHHLHYFDFESLSGLLAEHDLHEVRRTTDFPMEMFLLMGEDYTRDAAVGADAHARRRRFDEALDPATRRRFYGALAAAGLGRNAVILARKGSPPSRSADQHRR